jgi:hypothetical protein
MWSLSVDQELLQYLIFSLCQTYNKIFYLALNKLAVICSPILPYSSWGFWLSLCLGLLRGRTIHKAPLTHSLLNLTSRRFFSKDFFLQEDIVSQMMLSIAQCV